jgi:hypothetical protein
MTNEQLLPVLERILKNQYVLLTASNVQNFMDTDHKAEIFEITSAEAANTRLMLEDVQKMIKTSKKK